MTESQRHTAAEMLAILSARQLRDGQVVFAGVGIPLLAATLAQRLHCPGLTILFEGGVIGAFVEPGKLPPSTNDQRCTKRANMVLGSADVLLLLQRGYVDVGFMGGAQIDQYGNLNSSFIGDPARAEDAAAGHRRRQRHREPDQHDRRDEAREAALRGEGRLHHQPRLHPRRDRRALKAGCRPAACSVSITELAVFGFDDETRRMKVLALNPGVEPRAGSGQHRFRTPVRRRAFDDRASDRPRA